MFFSGDLPTKDVWIVAILLLTVVAFICLQMNYLNKALDVFDTSIVTPVYYVMFTTMVIVVSAILFREWANMEATSILGATCGFGITIVAIFLLTSSHKEKLVQSFASSREYGSNHYLPRTVWRKIAFWLQSWYYENSLKNSPFNEWLGQSTLLSHATLKLHQSCIYNTIM